jgi:excisionase family DNA binding protein
LNSALPIRLSHQFFIRLELVRENGQVIVESGLVELSMEKQSDPTSFLTPHQAAKVLNLPTYTVLRMIHRKELPALKVGTRWRIPVTELAKWAQAHRET